MYLSHSDIERTFKNSIWRALGIQIKSLILQTVQAFLLIHNLNA